MDDPATTSPDRPRLDVGVVLRVREDTCELRTTRGPVTARYASGFPSPRTERVSPGHLVALAAAADGAAVVVWRWYDAVVVAESADGVVAWEPAHGEVVARPRPSYVPTAPGGRAYLSAGLPGADWWIAGPAGGVPADADVELDEVERLYTEHDRWGTV